MSYFNGPPIITSGLVFTIDAADKNSYVGSGSTWLDLSNNRNNVSLFNSPSFNTSNGGSLTFVSASATYGEFSGSVNNFISGSLELWVKYNSVGDSAANQIFARRNTNAGTFTIIKTGADLITFNLRTNNGLTLTAISSTTTITSNWTLITATYNGTTQALYLNSQLSNTSSVSGLIDTTGTLLYNIGRNVTGLNYSNVNIGIIRLYNRALSATEVQLNYNSMKSRYGL
jgi:hypothetical protein